MSADQNKKIRTACEHDYDAMQRGRGQKQT